MIRTSPFISPTVDEQWMRVALAEADAAALAGDVPIGCVVVNSGGVLVGTGRNRREVDQDPTAHAEIVALRQAALRAGHWRLEGATLYVTLEPCVMCAGALVCARVSRVVYAAADAKAGGIDSKYRIGQDRQLNHCFEVDGGLLRDEAAERLQRFFADLRAQGQK